MNPVIYRLKAFGYIPVVVSGYVIRRVRADFPELGITANKLRLLSLIRLILIRSDCFTTKHLYEASVLVEWGIEKKTVYEYVKYLYTSGLIERTFEKKLHMKVAYRYMLTVKGLKMIKRMDKHYLAALKDLDGRIADLCDYRQKTFKGIPKKLKAPTRRPRQKLKAKGS